MQGFAIVPVTTTLSVSLPAASKITDLSTLRKSAETMVSEQGRLAQLIIDGNLWAVIATFFGLGLLLAFTPCVLPMIPILTSIIAGEGDKTSPMRGFTLAFSYVMGMALVYTAAGAAAAAAGAQLQATFNQPWVLIVFAGFFVLLARRDVRRLRPADAERDPEPARVGRAATRKAVRRLGAFIMGALSALIVTACVAPALIAALTVMAQTGDMLRGGAALFAMSLGMGAPLLLVGAAQGHLLPRAGGWMVAVKIGVRFHAARPRDLDAVAHSVRQRNARAVGRADVHGRRIHGRLHVARARRIRATETRQGCRLPRHHLRPDACCSVP